MIKKLIKNKDILWLGITISIALIGVIIVYQLWNKDFSVPITYHGDGVGAVFTIKNFIEGQEIWDFKNIAAPYGETILSQDYFLNILIIKILALFCEDAGVVVNIYWLLTYVLTAITMYMLLRKLKMCPVVAMAGAVIYDFLPYHYFRLQHFWLMGFYLIPIAAWIIMDILDDSFLDNFKNENKISFKKILTNRRVWLDIFWGILIGFGGVYYAIFTIIILGIVAVYRAIECKQWIYIGIMTTIVIVIVSPIVLFFLLPGLLLNQSAFSAIADARNITQINSYGLNLCLLLFPIPGHRLEILNDFTSNYLEIMNANNEGYIVQMGTIMSIGLIVSIISLFFPRIFKSEEKRMVRLGRLNIAILLIATIGGLNNFIALFVTSTVRCYNRMVVFVAAFSVICICILLNKFFELKNLNSYIKYFVIFAVVILGIWDQTSEKFAEYEEYNITENKYAQTYADTAVEYYNNEQFINNISAEIDEEQMVYLMPSNEVWSEERKSFDKKKAPIASYEVNWSYSVEKMEYRKWMQEIEEYEMPIFLNILSVVGYSGIIIDKNSFATDEEFEERIAEIEECIDKNPIMDESGTLYFYNISEYKKEFCAQYSSEELQGLKSGIEASMYIECKSLMGKELEVTSDSVIEKKDGTLSIPKSETQYGPYINLEDGLYEVVVCGKDLEELEVWMTAEGGKIRIPVNIVYQTSECVKYDFVLEQPLEKVEFLMKNEKQNVIVDEYYYISCSQEKFFHRYKENALDIRKYQSEVKYGHIYKKIPYSKLWMGDVQCTYAKDKLFIEKGVLQYGPYLALETGNYRVIIQGEGLKNAEVRATCLAGGEQIEIKEVRKLNNILVYEFSLTSPKESVEFLLINYKNDMIIDKYGYEKNKEEIF